LGSTIDDYLNLPQIHYSSQAFKYKNTIRLCDNDCGAYIYNVPGQEKPLNAEISKKDSLHENTCSVLLKTWMIAKASNWYPSGSFLGSTELLIEGIIKIYKKELTVKVLFEEIEELYGTAIWLDGSLHARKVKNEEAKQQWKEEKERKKLDKIKRTNQQ
jgi:hypothetical protein